jgi:hypothetical protein
MIVAIVIALGWFLLVLILAQLWWSAQLIVANSRVDFVGDNPCKAFEVDFLKAMFDSLNSLRLNLSASRMVVVVFDAPTETHSSAAFGLGSLDTLVYQ